MEILMLLVVLMTALSVSALIVGAFAAAMDGVLTRLLNAEMAAAWSLYAKFAVFAASFVGGLRLPEISAYVPSAGSAPREIGASQCLLEVYKSMAGVLSSASWTLLVFFGAALGVYAALQVYAALKTSPAGRFGEERARELAGRH